MALKCTMIALARYAVASPEGMLTIAGTIDTLNVSVRGPLAEGAGPMIPLHSTYLVFCVSASLVDGLHHELQFGMRHEDGAWVIPVQSLGPLDFRVNSKGRLMRAQGVVELNGIVVPAAGDYDLVLLASGVELATHPLYVDLLQAQ